MSKRAYTQQEIETELLSRSARRCCFCFGLGGDFGEKKGQIAHVNRKASDSRLDNLAWLCLPHHDEYDSKPSQSKGYTPHELRKYRKELYDEVERRRSSVSAEPASAPAVEPLRQRLRSLLRTINPEVLQLVDAGQPQIRVMIAVPNEMRLVQMMAEDGFDDLMKVSGTGSSIVASRGCSIGGHLNDLLDGMNMNGYLLEPVSALTESSRGLPEEPQGPVPRAKRRELLLATLEQLSDEAGYVSTCVSELRRELGDGAKGWPIHEMMMRLDRMGCFEGSPYFESSSDPSFAVQLR
jgi:hypothetical protein